jgi:hypothetical protein
MGMIIIGMLLVWVLGILIAKMFFDFRHGTPRVRLTLRMDIEALELIDCAALVAGLSREEFIQKAFSLGIRHYLPDYERTTEAAE